MITHKLRGKPIWRNHEVISLYDAKMHTMDVYKRPEFAKSRITLADEDGDVFLWGPTNSISSSGV